jgi:hypothetical protein
MTFDGVSSRHVEVDDIEYKDMLKSLRATDDAKSVWLRATNGVMYNMCLVRIFYIESTHEAK